MSPAPGARLPARSLWVNGTVVRGPEAALSLFDRGARDGGALFETVRVEGGHPIGLARHLERLVLSAAVLGFPVPPGPATLREGLERALEANGLEDAAARLTVTRGIPGGRPTRATAWIDVEPLASRRWRGTRARAAAVVVSRTPFEPGPLGAHKTTSRLAYDLAREEARAAGADEALLASAAGELLEGAVSSLFVVAAGEVATPPLARGILPGTMRARVLERAAALGLVARERPLALTDLESADEVFVTNAIQGLVPVARVGGRPVPAGAIADRLGRAIEEAARGEPDPA